MSSSTSNNKKTQESVAAIQEPVAVTAPTEPVKKRNMLNDFISPKFISHKVIYFVLNMYIYAFHTVQTLLFKSEAWKLSFGITGLMSTVLIGNYFGGKMWGKMADRTGSHKKILVCTTLVYTFLSFFICFPELVVFSKDGYFKNIYPDYKIFGNNLALWSQIISGWILFFVFNFFLSSAFPLTDRLVIGMLSSNQEATKDSLSTQRLFGAFGHFLISALGLAFFNVSKKKEEFGFFKSINEWDFVKNFNNGSSRLVFDNAMAGKLLIVILQIFSSALFIGCILFLVPKSINLTKKKASASKSSKSTDDKDFTEEEVKDTRSPEMILLSNPSFLMFILFVLCSGLTRCVTANYGKLIIDNLIGAKGTQVIRDAEAARCVTEVLAYATSPFIKKSLGIYWVLVMSQGLSVGRMIAYGLVPKNVNIDDPKADISLYQWSFIMALECAKGFTSGFISSSAIPIAHNMAPAGCETSAQTLYSGVYSGLSSLVGGLLCWIYMDGFTTNQIEDTMALNFWLGLLCGIVSVAMIGKFIFVDRVMGFPGFPARKQV